jgi:hypothetical protein
MSNVQTWDIEGSALTNIKGNKFGKGNCVLGVYEYSDVYNAYGKLNLPEKRLGLISGFDNTHLKQLYDNFKPIFVLFTPLFSDTSIWYHKNNDSDSSFYEKLTKLGEVYIDEPVYNTSDPNNKFSLKDVLFDNHNERLYEKLLSITKFKEYGSFLEMGYRKIIPIGYDTSCPYAFHFANKYHQKCSHVVPINNRRFTEKNYKKTKDRIMRDIWR